MGYNLTVFIHIFRRPQELDEAARRRLVKRLYIPLPKEEARIQMVSNLLNKQSHGITGEDLLFIGKRTEGLCFVLSFWVSCIEYPILFIFTHLQFLSWKRCIYATPHLHEFSFIAK